MILTSFLIVSQILVFTHIAFGEIAGASLLWSVKELVSLAPNRLKWLRISNWVAFGSIMLAWIAGGSYYLFLYPIVKPVIKDGPQSWAHLVFTESKEHIFLFLPVLIFVLALFAHRKGSFLLENQNLKRKFLYLTLFAAALVFSMAVMGYMITWGACTALWLKSGL